MYIVYDKIRNCIIGYPIKTLAQAQILARQRQKDGQKVIIRKIR